MSLFQETKVSYDEQALAKFTSHGRNVMNFFFLKIKLYALHTEEQRFEQHNHRQKDHKVYYFFQEFKLYTQTVLILTCC